MVRARFLPILDVQAWRTVLISFVLFGGVGLVFVLGAPLLGLKGAGAIERWMGVGVGGPLGPLVAVGGFTLLAFLGAPQFVLIAAAVLAFGPDLGFVYSWAGTLVSALVGFVLGRRFGARVLSRYAGRNLNRFIAMVGRNGFWASLVIRLLPSAPFIVVNMAAGLTPMRIVSFAAGTAIGIIPKIGLTAFAGGALSQALQGKGRVSWVSLGVAAGLWILAGVCARAWIKRREAQEARSGPAAGSGSGPSNPERAIESPTPPWTAEGGAL
jgi:uncharacterized membrane protein YdjX (TVP38/TMEM64 family)